MWSSRFVYILPFAEENLFYLPFLTLGPSAQQLNGSNTVDDSSSPIINLPTPLPMGESNQTIAYVSQGQEKSS